MLRGGKEVGKILLIPRASKHHLVICQVTGGERLERVKGDGGGCRFGSL